MASLFAARLARAGQANLTLTGSWSAALQAITARGVSVEEDGRTWTVPMATAASSDTLGPADFVLVLVKSHQTAAVADTVARALAPAGLAVTLQNGLGNRDVLAQVVGEERVAVGVATLGATLVAPGRVRAVPGDVILGAEPAAADRIQALAGLFRAAGIDTHVSAEIRQAVWRKLAVNCSINPLSALHGVPNGALLESPALRASLADAAREVGAVAAACGIDLAADPAELAVSVATKTATNRSSMLQDFDRGSPTEIDALCGAVVREGRRRGVPTPVNESLWQQVRIREAAA
jgi:2-dehydropantoate 2-reductase